jgi:hypothetical protein
MFDNSMEPLEPRRRPRVAAAHTDAIAKRHGLYTNDQMTLRGPARVYFADYQQKTEVMRAHDNRISTKHDDRQTIAAMLDLAQSRGWDRIRLRGNEAFKREAWVQAQVRGLETEGYRPKQTDIQHAERRREAAQPAERSTEQATTNDDADVAARVATARRSKSQREKAEQPPERQEPQAAEAENHQQQRQDERSVWNVVEKQGSSARASEGAKQQQQPAQQPAQRPAVEVA